MLKVLCSTFMANECPHEHPYVDVNHEWYIKLCSGAVLTIASVRAHALLPPNLRITIAS